CSKASGLQWLLDQMDCGASQVMAIGDNYNDFEMLQMAGYPVIMGNCTPGLASYGWRLTHSNDQDGVAHAIHTLALK
ncbi:MAG TPA: HAD hydrolase family protein, partial [Terriglobia bacterium]|nr:HAD hydrolase family protein [Terriglobia bacterium]